MLATTTEPSGIVTTPDGHHEVGRRPTGAIAGGVTVRSTLYAPTAFAAARGT